MIILIIPADQKTKMKRCKALTHASVNELLKGRHILINAFESRIFLTKSIVIDVIDDNFQKH